MAFMRTAVYGIAGLILFFVQPGSSLFSWHPASMTVATMVFMYEGVLMLQPQKGLLDKQSRDVKKNVHGFLQFLSAITMCLGSLAVYTHKNNMNKPHLTSLHSIMGFLAGCLIIGQIFGGIATKYPMLAPMNRKFMKFGHAVFGMVIYLIIIVTVITGILSPYMSSVTPPFFQIAMMVLPLLTFGTSYTNVMHRIFHTILRPKT